MRSSWVGALMAASLMPAVALAGNSDEVNAGLDVTLTGGAVVANVYTGAALWYNPAGLSRVGKPSLELTGVTFDVQMVDSPGLITLDTDPQVKSAGSDVNFSVIPQAITFTVKLKRHDLKLGIGLFHSSLRKEFLTERATSTPGTTPVVKAYAGRNSRDEFFHASTGIAGRFSRRKQKVLLGGAFDLVVASNRIDESYSLLYDEGTAGQVSAGQVLRQTGFGFQLKAGMQWVPIPKVRVGLSIASPAYVFAVLERFASSYTQAPPAGTPDDPNDPNRQLAGGDEDRGGRGVWWGVDPGNLRFGIAYVGHWGWIEGDLIYHWRLREAEIGLDLRGFWNVRMGSAFRVNKAFKLGLGLFTDFSQVDRLSILPLATRKVDFYGVHLGILYSNREVHPDRQSTTDEDGIGISVAVGIRYAHGRGDTIGLSIPPSYDPSGLQQIAVPTKINEIAINLGAKVAF